MAKHLTKVFRHEGHLLREIRDPIDICGVTCFIQSAARHPHHAIEQQIHTNVIRLNKFKNFLVGMNSESCPTVVFVSSNVVDKLLWRSPTDSHELVYGLTKLYGEVSLAKNLQSLVVLRLTGIAGPKIGRSFFNQLLWRLYLGHEVSVVESGVPFSEFCTRESVAKILLNIDYENERFSLRGGYAAGDLLLTDLILEAKKLLGSTSRCNSVSNSRVTPYAPLFGSYEKGLEYLPDTQIEMLRYAISDMLSESPQRPGNK